MAPQAIILLSGGIDSAACAHFAKSSGAQVSGLFVSFGQPAATQEASAARALADQLCIPLKIFHLTPSRELSTGELLGRNMFLATTALFVSGITQGAIYAGIHAGTPYFDCSPRFCELANSVLSEHTDGRVSYIAPFITWTKAEIFAYFNDAQLPIALTYSCEAGDTAPCGNCASCSDRRAIGC